MVEFPKINEFVVCKITKITNYGVFAELLEYDNLEGFIHISQVSSTWIKNIHNHVKPNQVRSAKVLSVDETKKHVDLSFNRVSSADEKRKISDYRLFKRAQGLLQVVASELNLSEDEIWDKVADPILEQENNLYVGFVNFLKYGPEKFEGLDKKIIPKLKEILEKNIAIKDKRLNCVLEVSSTREDGLEIIKKGLLKCVKDFPKATITYKGPGKYDLSVYAIDYKEASKDLKNICEIAQKNLKGCNFNIIKEEKNK